MNTAREVPDPLESPLGAARWWAAAGIALEAKPRFDPALAAALRRLRSAIERGVSGAPCPLPAEFRGDASDAILFEALHAARCAAADGRLRKVRVCAGQGCARYFLDETKNGSRRWCSLRCMERARSPRRRTISG